LNFGTDSVSIIWFSMGIWNYSHSVALSVFLLDIGTDQRVWHDWFFYETLELYWQCAIICFSIVLLNRSDSEYYLFFYGVLKLFPQCDIIGFSMGLLNSTDSVPLFVFLWGFGTIPTVWHYWFFILLLDFGTVPIL
jgi:hypothetical protein